MMIRLANCPIRNSFVCGRAGTFKSLETKYQGSLPLISSFDNNSGILSSQSTKSKTFITTTATTSIVSFCTGFFSSLNSICPQNLFEFIFGEKSQKKDLDEPIRSDSIRFVIEEQTSISKVFIIYSNTCGVAAVRHCGMHSGPSSTSSSFVLIIIFGYLQKSKNNSASNAAEKKSKTCLDRINVRLFVTHLGSLYK